MPAVTASVTLRIPGELLERVDRLVATSRNAWLLWVIEEAVKRGETEEKYSPSTRAVERALEGAPVGSERLADRPPAPAEQPEGPEMVTTPEVRRRYDAMMGRRPAREFRPYPKGG